MVFKLLEKVFSSANDRAIKRFQPDVASVNALEAKIKQLSDAQLQAKTAEFKTKLEQGAPLDSIRHEAFAVSREAAWRVLGMRPYDVQLLGGFVLHAGQIAEMKTGEGKTLVAVQPCYLNALTGKGVHVVTVNDYLARRDAEWMGQVYRWLGLSTGVIINDLDDHERQIAYGSDITYGQNNEFGFDYLRDNMKYEPQTMFSVNSILPLLTRLTRFSLTKLERLLSSVPTRGVFRTIRGRGQNHATPQKGHTLQRR